MFSLQIARNIFAKQARVRMAAPADMTTVSLKLTASKYNVLLTYTLHYTNGPQTMVRGRWGEGRGGQSQKWVAKFIFGGVEGFSQTHRKEYVRFSELVDGDRLS